MNYEYGSRIKETKVTISLWTIPQRKGSSLKRNEESHTKLKTIFLVKGSEKEKGLPRHVNCPLTQITEKSWGPGIGKKVRGKVHDLLERTWFKRRSCENGKIRKRSC